MQKNLLRSFLKIENILEPARLLHEAIMFVSFNIGNQEKLDCIFGFSLIYCKWENLSSEPSTLMSKLFSDSNLRVSCNSIGKLIP